MRRLIFISNRNVGLLRPTHIQLSHDLTHLTNSTETYWKPFYTPLKEEEKNTSTEYVFYLSASAFFLQYFTINIFIWQTLIQTQTDTDPSIHLEAYL